MLQLRTQALKVLKSDLKLLQGGLNVGWRATGVTAPGHRCRGLKAGRGGAVTRYSSIVLIARATDGHGE